MATTTHLKDPEKESKSPLYIGYEHKNNDTQFMKFNSDCLVLNMDNEKSNTRILPCDSFQQMQLLEEQNSYTSSRSSAIQSIESTIHELGSIFSQLAQMVAEQRETVQRISTNTDNVVTNVSSAQQELLKYYQRISSNRWLMFKIFGILTIFFLLFVIIS